MESEEDAVQQTSKLVENSTPAGVLGRAESASFGTLFALQLERSNMTSQADERALMFLCRNCLLIPEMGKGK